MNIVIECMDQKIVRQLIPYIFREIGKMESISFPFHVTIGTYINELDRLYPGDKYLCTFDGEEPKVPLEVLTLYQKTDVLVILDDNMNNYKNRFVYEKLSTNMGNDLPLPM